MSYARSIGAAADRAWLVILTVQDCDFLSFIYDSRKLCRYRFAQSRTVWAHMKYKIQKKKKTKKIDGAMEIQPPAISK